MQIVVLSDIHANMEALEAVLSHASGWDELWFLGDAVGYGPDPEGCVERLAALEPAVWLAGNHDHAALGIIDTSEFNPEARRAAEWTREQLGERSRERLSAARPRVELPEHSITLVHGSPRQPIREYILNAAGAAENFEHFATERCLFGHTHVPIVYLQAVDGVLRIGMEPGIPVALEPESRYLINPGSVGQPRDGDPRAAYLRFDLQACEVTLHRVAYPIEATQTKILAAELPPRLAARLEYGW